MNTERDYIEIDLRKVWNEIKQNILSIILIIIICAGVTGIYSFFIAKPQYRSTSKLYILGSSTSITSLADVQVGSSLTNDYRELIMGRPVLTQVKRNLNLEYSYRELQEIVSVDTPSDTRLVNINVVTDDSYLSRDIANEIANVAKKQISHIMDTDPPSIAERAVATRKPIKPQKIKMILLGAIVGFFFGCMYHIIKFLLNDYITTREDVENELGLIVLSEIPNEGGKHGTNGNRRKKSRRNK